MNCGPNSLFHLEWWPSNFVNGYRHGFSNNYVVLHHSVSWAMVHLLIVVMLSLVLRCNGKDVSRAFLGLCQTV